LSQGEVQERACREKFDPWFKDDGAAARTGRSLIEAQVAEGAEEDPVPPGQSLPHQRQGGVCGWIKALGRVENEDKGKTAHGFYPARLVVTGL
jgi:hypothetical protein